MNVWMERFKGAIWSFWLLVVLLAIVALYVAVYVYRLKFGGGFSSEASDWSDFGGYIGGVFGPLVSFLTLLAVLNTVYLQRDLLRAQSKEFELINERHDKGFNSQQLQILEAGKAAQLLQISAAKDSASKVIDMRLSLYWRFVDIQKAMASRSEKSSEVPESRLEELDIKYAVMRKGGAEFAVHLLSQLALQINVEEFESAEAVRKYLKCELDRVDVKAGFNPSTFFGF